MNTNFLKNLQLRLCSLLLVLLQLGFAQEVSFRITPLRPVEELRAEALKEQPPHEQGTFLKPDLVELVKLDPTIKLDIRYATSNNFLGTPLYTQARAFLQRPAAEALLRAHRELKAQGYGLIIHDGYRPWYVTKIFWDATPDDKKIFVADPAEGSKHNRGCAVDLSLYDLKTSQGRIRHSRNYAASSAIQQRSCKDGHPRELNHSDADRKRRRVRYDKA
jgi:zinc D-Ala-D-Ala dipeptidase